jgi:CubicO group peptidase (beta-lactamase class C family)
MTRDISESIPSIVEHITLKMKVEGMPGLAVAVTDREGVVWESAFGHSDIEAGDELTPDHLFQIGSISKSFADIILLQMRDEGLLDLHRPVTDYIPWFQLRSGHGPITLHHLMTHTAGLPLGSDDTISAVTEVMALRGLDASTPPGEHFHYSNTGYKAIGLVMEGLSRKSFPEVLRERILEPLQMRSSEPAIDNSLRDRLAVGYAPFIDDRPLARNGRLAPSTWFESDTADGSICSNIRDMCQYIRMILNRGEGPGGRILSEEGFRLLTAPYIRPDDSVHGEEYAYGLNIEHVDGHLYVGHTGGMVGFNSSMLMDMDEGLGVIILINSPGRPDEISRFVLDILRADSDPGRPRPDIVPENPFSVKKGEQYSGEYRSVDGRVLGICVKDGGLWIHHNGCESQAEKLGEDRFLVHSSHLDMFELRFGRSDGEVVEALHGPDAFFNDRYSGPAESRYPEEWNGYTGHFRSHNPWLANFRVLVRKGVLRIIDPSGLDEPLVPLPGGDFRIGEDPRCPESVRFDSLLNGRAHMAFISGGAATRVSTP